VNGSTKERENLTPSVVLVVQLVSHSCVADRASFETGFEGLKAMEIEAKQYDKRRDLKTQEKADAQNGPPQ